jgi:hypothetical protein
MLVLLGYISGLLSAVSYFPYIRDILHHKTKPERASWFIWLLLGSIAFSSQLAKGASDSLWLTGVQTLGVGIVFLLSFRHGVGGFTRKDILAIIIAIGGVGLWLLTKEAATALYIVIFVDVIGVLLTVQKAYHDPGSETLITWILAGASGLLAMLAVGNWNPVLLSYPFYILLANAAVISAILVGKRINKRNKRG